MLRHLEKVQLRSVNAQLPSVDASIADSHQLGLRQILHLEWCGGRFGVVCDHYWELLVKSLWIVSLP